MPITHPREYQKTILETAKKQNTLVVLPTGLGKTLIALLLAVERKKLYPLSRILFLAPTRPLIEQHFNYFKSHLPELFADLQLFTGSVPAENRKKIWETAEIIFSTPQCIANDLPHSLYSLSEVSLIIIDEAHRCVKNYDYTKVISYYKNQSKFPRILGLTASPGHDPDLVRKICEHLDIEAIELRSRDSLDVKGHVEELEFTKQEVPFPKEFIELKTLLTKLYDSKLNQIRSSSLASSPLNKITLLKLQSRLALQSHPSKYYGMSLTAQAIKLSHALELLETQTLSGLNSYLNSLKQQADEKKSKGVQTLVNSGEFQASLLSLKHLLDKNTEHPKVSEVLKIAEEELKNNKNAKIIVFSQYRDTANLLVSRLSSLPNIRPALFIGQAKKKNLGLTQKEQKAIIEQFKKNEINVLCCTSIGEEGLDIPEVNAVIFYEPIPSAIRKIQRAGRTARLSPGKLIILITQDTRDVIHHYASSAREKKMHKTISLIKEEIKNKPKPKKTLGDFI